MKKPSFIFIFSVLSLGLGARAGADLVDFRDYVDSNSLRPFARDLGDVLGSASFHSGRLLGLTGFDIGAHGGLQLRPDPHDDILRRSGVGAFGLPWAQAELGLPFRLEGFIRGASYQGLTVSGGGLRYGLLKVSDLPWTPQVLLSAVANSVSHRDFSASHFGFNLVGSLNFPLVSPYAGAGVDRTRVMVLAATQPASASLVGGSATTLESRFTGGVSVKPFPFSYLHGAYVLAHGKPGFDMGLGMRF